jgi:hypothetical protein
MISKFTRNQIITSVYDAWQDWQIYDETTPIHHLSELYGLSESHIYHIIRRERADRKQREVEARKNLGGISFRDQQEERRRAADEYNKFMDGVKSGKWPSETAA